MKLNLAKCIFEATEIKYLGHILSGDGIRADPKKISAIRDMPAPCNKEDLQRFLGMITYLGKFLPNLATETAPLRLLLEKGTEWSFDKPQKQAFEKLKDLVTESPVLKFFDPNLPIKVTSDASQHGLGAILEQCHDNKWFSVAYASRSLTSSEKNYCQLERECLSIVFATERFNQYIYGQSFLVENDHQPLKSIFTKAINRAPPRIQRFLLRLQRYDFGMNYKPGKEIKVADTLSRAHLQDSRTEIPDVELDFVVHSVISSLPISPERLNDFKQETTKDDVLQKLKDFTVNGWPEKKDDVPLEVRPYFNCRDEMSYSHGLLLKGEKIIVPSSLRKEMRTLIHQGHLGIEKCKTRARDTFYWPGMNQEITDLVANCETCITFRNYHQKETLKPHEIPSSPWIKVGTDVFHLKNKHYLIIVDYHSKFF